MIYAAKSDRHSFTRREKSAGASRRRPSHQRTFTASTIAKVPYRNFQKSEMSFFASRRFRRRPINVAVSCTCPRACRFRPCDFTFDLSLEGVPSRVSRKSAEKSSAGTFVLVFREFLAEIGRFLFATVERCFVVFSVDMSILSAKKVVCKMWSLKIESFHDQ